jgi:DNA-binding NarL/FixJ family response regulator
VDQELALLRALTLFAIDPATLLKQGVGGRGTPAAAQFSTRWGDNAALGDRLIVWIDEPDPLVRLGLERALAADGTEVAGTSAGFRPLPDLSPPGSVLLFDLGHSGLEPALEAKTGTPARLVAIIPRPDLGVVATALRAGVDGVLVRGTLDPRRLTSCLRAVSRGQACVPVDQVNGLVGDDDFEPPRTNLTRRELQVLELLAEGEDTRGMANRLCYAERTIKNIVHDVLVKLQCKTRAHAVARATRERII